MKHRLRHPIRAIREPFGTAGLIIACVALIAALGGTALAAKGALTGKQKKEVEKIAKKFAGKPGANGANGAPGAKGDTGAAGSNGTNGTNGSPGAPGAPGKSVEVSEGAAGCVEDGITVTVSGTTEEAEVCNGEEGSPWTAGGTLPQGVTEKGMWSMVSGPKKATPFVFGTSPISFNLPLAAAPTAYILQACGLLPEEEETEPGVFIHPRAECEAAQEPIEEQFCPGTAEEPKAEEGNLCAYVEFASGLRQAKIHILGTKFGGVVQFISPLESESGALADGSWAVTGS